MERFQKKKFTNYHPKNEIEKDFSPLRLKV